MANKFKYLTKKSRIELLAPKFKSVTLQCLVKIEFLDKKEDFFYSVYGPHLHILTTKQTTLTSVNDTLEEQRNNRVIA